MSDCRDCCSGGSCCPPEHDGKQLLIDFLYLDLSVCERCQSAESNLDQAIDEVSRVLKAAGFEIVVNKVNVNSKELAIKYQFESSPTIRVNGIDVQLDVQESSCKDCGDLCGDDIDCRVYAYEGVEYSFPPKAMIINAILKSVYGGQRLEPCIQSKYELPDNLQKYFDGISGR